ncbi:lipid-A-disaccharide synthase [Leptolyngbya ohadii]|uniref:lipid-A-disaccharide synthase n=1 Tax=Leptolyngbya ohadii TaxID=1962290 RepID=UPI000B59C4FE|nr:lipid-A-disaccharide synthase [Leptolyngbya ohadii]
MAQVKRRIFISTGEVSGDLQGSLLVEALYRQANLAGIDLEIVAAGGDRMAQAGAKLLADTTAIGSIGLVESVRYVLPTILVQRRLKQWLRQNPPDLVVMIDYLGPNIGIASFTRSTFPNVPTVYYIAPQEWVWSISAANTRRIVNVTDRLLAIFPAEAEYYRKWGSDVAWVGHPLIDRMQNAPSRSEARAALGIASEATIVSLIPASRRQEIQYILPVMFQAARQLQDKLEDQLPQLEFLVPLSLETYREAIDRAIQSYGLRARLVSGQTREVLAASDLAITKSGTVNLELALLNVPQVVMYRLNPITAWIAENLLKYAAPFVSPVNLVLMQPIVPEMLQRQATPDRLVEESLDFLLNPDCRSQILANYERMRQQLGEPGVSDRAAQEILAMLPEMA